MNILTILLQADAAAPAQKGGGWSTILMMVAIFAIFYLFMIRPQQKKAKEIRKQRASIEKGAKVVTSGGIYGIVSEIKESSVMLEIADGVKIKIDKNSIYLSPEDIQQQGK
ncbi:MAG: preprotein translocase subunit YajC [Paludibacter sp.]|jgi:preprotein translocase subunit YajC|nr:preprotein translocase subunit YajC [Paludibacter sp.]